MLYRLQRRRHNINRHVSSAYYLLLLLLASSQLTFRIDLTTSRAVNDRSHWAFCRANRFSHHFVGLNFTSSQNLTERRVAALDARGASSFRSIIFSDCRPRIFISVIITITITAIFRITVNESQCFGRIHTFFGHNWMIRLNLAQQACIQACVRAECKMLNMACMTVECNCYATAIRRKSRKLLFRSVEP